MSDRTIKICDSCRKEIVFKTLFNENNVLFQLGWVSNAYVKGLGSWSDGSRKDVDICFDCLSNDFSHTSTTEEVES